MLRSSSRQLAAHWRRLPSSVRSRTTLAAVGTTADQQQHSWSATAAALAATALVATQLLPSNSSKNNKTDCCAIVGVIGDDAYTARKFLLNGLTVLKNRGFDSAGIATMGAKGESMTITKYASIDNGPNSVDLTKSRHELKEEAKRHAVGIAHTRWATTGARTDENAHPHTDAKGRIALVHNGTITNADELRKEILQKDETVKFEGQTDSEVLAKLIGLYYNGSNLKPAVEKALSRCDGTWGLAVMSHVQPDELVVACNGSPLIVGVDDNKAYVASEAQAFAGLTKTVVHMNDGEIASLYSDGRSLDFSRVEEVEMGEHEDEEKLTPDPFPHWTLKELNEAPQAVARALGFGGRMGADRIHLGGLDHSVEKLKSIKHLVLAGCATSLNAAKFGELLMKQLGSVNSVSALDAAETELKDFPDQENLTATGLVVISQSGETKDAVTLVQAAKAQNIQTMSVVNSVGSSIARATKLGVYCNAGRENAVASTKAFSSQVTVLALIALWFQQIRPKLKKQQEIEAERLKESLMRLPLAFGSALQTHSVCKEVALRMKGKEHCFILGKGFGEPVAQEGALKMKEFSYIHAEGYSGGSLEHGPFSLLQSDLTGKQGATPVLMIVLDDEHAQDMRMAAEAVKSRGAQVHIITDNPSLAEDVDPNPIVIPNNGPLTALGATIPLTLIAYELALMKGINPDTPRNLAKAVLTS